MRVEVEPADFADVEPLREGFRAAAGCQIVHDSILPRGLADAWIVRADGAVAAYGGLWNEHFPGRVVEFHALEPHRDARHALFERFLRATGATELEAQTNMPDMMDLLRTFGRRTVEEKVLFRDGGRTALTPPGGTFRRRGPDEPGPEGAWVVERDGRVVAAGGVLTHYNPPWGDLYMEVDPSVRRRGLGSWIVQELRRVCREAGHVPAARCDPGNLASWRALERGGMARCGTLLSASVALPRAPAAPREAPRDG